MVRQAIENPILNGPYEEPSRHWRFDEQGIIQAEVVEGRRPSESWVPVPPARKGKAQQQLPLEPTTERRQRNEQINQLRARVGVWRQRGYPDVSLITRRLLEWDGNTWEQIVAQSLEVLDDVAAYVKNDHLTFAVPYIHAGRTHRYLPDFLVRLARRADGVERFLIVEVSGTMKSRAITGEKSDTARNLWCAAVNNHGGWGRWGFIEITNPTRAKAELKDAIKALYADAPITGLPT